MNQSSLKSVTVHCIGNAHIDPVWRWPLTEGCAETIATCRSAIDRLKEYDTFIFSRGQAATYVWIEEIEPELFELIRHYVKLGRWKFVNGWWEQPDANIPCGESFVRHCLYGKNYFREKFGADVTTGWNPDTFGHTLGLPQILARSGYTSYVFFRPGSHEMNLPGPFFWWQGPDGSRVLAIRPPVGHYCTGGDKLSEQLYMAAEEALKLGFQHTLLCYGVGNHGGGPTIKNLNSIQEVNASEDGPNAIFSSVDSFVKNIADKFETLPTVTTDLQHHAPGCYTTHSEIKRLNRAAENRLMRAERWSSLAEAASGLSYPAKEFAEAWKLLLFNQFHDVLAGTSIPSAYDIADEQISSALSTAESLQNRALQSLSRHIDTRIDNSEPPAAGKGFPVLLFNPLPWHRIDIADVQWGSGGKTLEEGKATLVDEIGNAVPFQYAQPDMFGGGLRIKFEANIPSHGWRVYRMLPSSGTNEAASSNVLSIGDTWLENQFWRLEFDQETGAVERLYDRRRNLDITEGGIGSLLVMEDRGDSWGHDIPSWREEVGKFTGAKFTVKENGSSAVTLLIENGWNHSTARQEFTLYRSNPRIDVQLKLDWREKHKMLKLSIPLALDNVSLTCDSAYSVIERKTLGLEDPCQNWINMNGSAKNMNNEIVKAGLALLIEGKYGYDCLDSDIRLSLVRSPIFCFHDPAVEQEGREYLFMDQGEQTIHYALLPHAGDGYSAGMTKQAAAMQNPFQFLFQYPHEGDMGATGSLLSVTPDHVHAEALKGAESGRGTILRLFETEGKASDQVEVTLPGGRRLSTSISHWELQTFLIEPDGAIKKTDLIEREVDSNPAI